MNEQDAQSPEARKPRLLQPDRAQPDPNPRIVDNLVPPDHIVRTIWDLTEELDLAPLYAKIKAVEGHAGRPPADPRLLTALWLYATLDRIASPRVLERQCYECDPYKWLRGGVDVNYHTLSDFRTDHKDWLEQQVVGLVATMRAEGLINMDRLGQDGLRIRASAGSGSFKKEEKLDALLEEAQQDWDRLQDEFETELSNDPRRAQAQARAARERLERLKRAKEEVQKLQVTREARKKGDGQHARASTTDPEARRMKMPDGGFRPAYNAQFSTTLDTLVTVGVDLTNAGTDGGQMGPMVEQIHGQQGELPGQYYVDGGFSTKEDIERVGSQGITVFTPVKEADRQEEEGKDPYAPRRGEGPVLTEWRQRMGTADGKEKYKQRSKCEWSNAQVRNHGLYGVLVRGLDKVKAVVLWHILANNLLRMAALRAQHATG